MNPLVRCALICAGICFCKYFLFGFIRKVVEFFSGRGMGVVAVLVVLTLSASAQDTTPATLDTLQCHVDYVLLAVGLVAGLISWQIVSSRWHL